MSRYPYWHNGIFGSFVEWMKYPRSSLAWLTCAHQWRRYFGPCLRCARCGAQTIISMDPRESKPIYPPSAADA